MSKRISECDSSWTNLQTYALANQLNVDDFAKVASSCSTVDEFESGAKEIIMNKINSCKNDANNLCLDPNNNTQLFILAALDSVDICKLIQVAASCFPQKMCLCRLESRLNKICQTIEERYTH